MIRQYFFRHSRVAGFNLVELMVAIAVVGMLAATAVPAYSTYVKRARLLAAELTLVHKLMDFSVIREYSPASGMLADLVAEDFLNKIPNDPWTDVQPVNTGADEATDWYYENDGKNLYLYARSHPGRLYILPSFGLPPLLQVSENRHNKPDNDSKNKKKDKKKDKKKRRGRKHRK